MKIAALLAPLLLAGCATQDVVPAVQGESVAALKSERIAVKYTLATKRINYLETLYRVLYLETNASSQDFSGVWSPDRDLSSYAVARLREQGIDASNVHEIVDARTVESADLQLARFCAERANGEHKEIAGTKIIPEPTVFLESPQDPQYAALWERLNERGYRYLFELTAMDIYGNAIGYGGVVVAAFPNLRVIDLGRRKVIWSAQGRHAEPYQLGGDLKKLEENGMSKTKEGLKAGINKLDFAAMWGLR